MEFVAGIIAQKMAGVSLMLYLLVSDHAIFFDYLLTVTSMIG